MKNSLQKRIRLHEVIWQNSAGTNKAITFSQANRLKKTSCKPTQRDFKAGLIMTLGAQYHCVFILETILIVHVSPMLLYLGWNLAAWMRLTSICWIGQRLLPKLWEHKRLPCFSQETQDLCILYWCNSASLHRYKPKIFVRTTVLLGNVNMPQRRNTELPVATYSMSSLLVLSKVVERAKLEHQNCLLQRDSIWGERKKTGFSLFLMSHLFMGGDFCLGWTQAWNAALARGLNMRGRKENFHLCLCVSLTPLGLRELRDYSECRGPWHLGWLWSFKVSIMLQMIWVTSFPRRHL